MSRGKVTKFPGGKERPDWEVRLVKSREGDPKATAHNLMLILENHPEIQGLLALDEFANRVVFADGRQPPWPGASADEFSELDGVELSAWLGQPETYGMNTKTAAVLEAVEAVARRHRFHPVRDYLNGLVWDGVERIPTLFADYMGAARNAYTAQVGLNFMISSVARILEPGCKVDIMLILEGEQGAGKTKAVRKLFGGDRWYVDAQRSPAEKDFYQDLVGKWGVEIGEMTSFTKAESNKVKQTLSAQADVYRPSYGRYSKTFPRQCVFIGTTNESEYLRDHTGARRFLPVRVDVVDADLIVSARDQLWAEAVARFKRNEPWWTEPEGAREQQDERYMEDSWSDPVMRWLSGNASDQHYKTLAEDDREKKIGGRVLECTTTDLLLHALGVDLARHDRPAQMRIGQIMHRLKWGKYRVLRAGVRQWRWYRPMEDTGDA